MLVEATGFDRSSADVDDEAAGAVGGSRLPFVEAGTTEEEELVEVATGSARLDVELELAAGSLGATGDRVDGSSVREVRYVGAEDCPGRVGKPEGRTRGGSEEPVVEAVEVIADEVAPFESPRRSSVSVGRFLRNESAPAEGREGKTYGTASVEVVGLSISIALDSLQESVSTEQSNSRNKTNDLRPDVPLGRSGSPTGRLELLVRVGLAAGAVGGAEGATTTGIGVRVGVGIGGATTGVGAGGGAGDDCGG